MEQIDRDIINRLQRPLPVCERPYAEVAAELAIPESELLSRLQSLLDDGELSRFGPMYNVERMGGSYSLVAMKLPEEEFDEVTAIVNSFPQVAHNYKRDHAFNLWFVVATRTHEEQQSVLLQIEAMSGYRVYNMPKIKEYCIGARFAA